MMSNSTRLLLVSVLSILAWVGNAEMNVTDMSSYARIAGGTQTHRDRFPYFVRVDNHDRLHCGGVLIARDVVLTAAHCIVEGASLKAYTNAYNTFTEFDRMEVRTVKQAIKHPNYNYPPRSNDIGLLILSSPVSYAATIPVNGELRYPYDGDSMTVIGVGDRSSGGSSTTWLHEVQVKKVSYSTCAWSYGRDLVDSTMFCAREDGRDACQGDSGGPIIQNLGGVESVVGIVSWGRGCAQSQYPGVYARTSAVKAWIDENLRSVSTTMVTKPQQLSSLPIPLTVGSEKCDDDPQGTFLLGGAGKVNCRWLESNRDWQPYACSMSSVNHMCAETCGKCNDGCNDDPSAKFHVNGIPNLSCAFLRSNPNIASSVCKPGQPAFSACPETCKSCREAPAPTPYPTIIPTRDPTRVPTHDPTHFPTPKPTRAPTLEPTPEPTPTPTPEPTPGPTPGPTPDPTPDPTLDPTPDPTLAATPEPTLVPTTFPTPGPTQGRNSVRSDPIPFRSDCDDSDGTFRVNDHVGNESCVWLADRPNWQKLLCTPAHQVYSVCEETCKVCRDACEDSPRKFDMGGEIHDCEWLSLRADKKEKFCEPSHDAWKFCPETCESCDPSWTPPPTPAPQITKDDGIICDDSQRGRFWVNDILGSQPCAWLRARPVWQEELCEPGSIVADMCPETCGVCEDDCQDSGEKFIVKGEIHDCLWLSLRPNVQDEVCLDVPQNRGIRHICRETCNTCDGE